MLQLRIAAQLYTVRDLTAVDFADTVGKVAAVGYRHVELAGFGNLASATEVRGALDDHGLRCISSHVALEQFEQHAQTVLADAEVIGSQTLVIPWLPPERRNSGEDWRRFSDTLNGLGKLCHQRDFQLAYHHHAFEFEQFAGQTAFDIMWSRTDPALVKAELDVYWLAYAGQDPVGWINTLSNRVTLLHLKDMANTADRRFAEVGTGILDFPRILEAARSVGVSCGIVEQDDTYGRSPLESLKTSFEYLSKLGAM